MSRSAPEQVIEAVLKTGLAAIVANPDVLDTIWGDMPSDDLVSFKAYFARTQPTVVSGYPRLDGDIPVVAVTLAGDDQTQDYLGVGEAGVHAADMDADDAAFLLGDDAEGVAQCVRTTQVFGILVMDDNPSKVAALYRVVKRILRAGTNLLVKKGLQEPKLAGVELAPDPRYIPANIFARRLTLTVEVEEAWRLDDPLGIALEALSDRLSSAGTLAPIRHEDAGGGVHPYDTFDTDDDDE